MNDPEVLVLLDGDRHSFQPGEILSGMYHLRGIEPDNLVALELSVLWHTTGKGDDDLAVHLFKRFAIDEGDLIDPTEPGRFSTQLPPSPLTYDGVIVKIRWCVRVRVFMRRGRDVTGEVGFQCGEVPSARAVLPKGNDS